MEKRTKVTCIYSIQEFKRLVGTDRLDILKGATNYYGAVQGSRVCGVAPDAVPLLKTPDKLGVMEITDGVEVWYLIVPRTEQEVIASL